MVDLKRPDKQLILREIEALFTQGFSKQEIRQTVVPIINKLLEYIESLEK